MNRKRVILAAFILLSLAFVFSPFPSADIHLKIYFDEIKGNQCALYYETEDNQGYSQERCIAADVKEPFYVDFCLDASVGEKLTGLRIDMPSVEEEQVVCMKNVTVCSAGVIQKSFNPCYFMEPVNIAGKNGIPDISLVKVRKRAYISCGTNDPYWILSPELVREIQSGQSNYRGTRLGIVIFLFGCYFSGKMGLFSERTLECKEEDVNHEE